MWGSSVYMTGPDHVRSMWPTVWGSSNNEYWVSFYEHMPNIGFSIILKGSWRNELLSIGLSYGKTTNLRRSANPASGSAEPSNNGVYEEYSQTRLVTLHPREMCMRTIISNLIAWSIETGRTLQCCFSDWLLCYTNFQRVRFLNDSYCSNFGSTCVFKTQEHWYHWWYGYIVNRLYWKSLDQMSWEKEQRTWSYIGSRKSLGCLGTPGLTIIYPSYILMNCYSTKIKVLLLSADLNALRCMCTW